LIQSGPCLERPKHLRGIRRPLHACGLSALGKGWLPRVGRWITIQGDVVGTYEVNNRPSLCVVIQNFATGDSICPVTALEQLFLVDARMPSLPLHQSRLSASGRYQPHKKPSRTCRRGPRRLQTPCSHHSRYRWPGLDRWQAAHLEYSNATKQVEPNLAAGGFLELLQRLL
jgi:hypothetical protein